MRIGELRHRIEVWQQTPMDDGALGNKAVWSKVKDLWAKVMADEASIQLLDGQTVTTQPYRLVLRWNRNFRLDITQRFHFKGIDIIPHSIINVDERGQVCTVKGFADLTGTVTVSGPQIYENGQIQYYEG
jgi:head-tail adaptor